MHISEGDPESIFRAFHETDQYEESILCIILSNRKKEADFFKETIESVLEIDSNIQDKVALVLCSSSLPDALYTKRGNTGYFFPGWVVAGGDQYGEARSPRIRLVRDDWQDSTDEDVKKIVRNHQKFSEEICRYLGLDPSIMPYCVVSARGISKPWAHPINSELTIDHFKTFLSGLEGLVQVNDLIADRSRLNLDLIQRFVDAYEKNEKRIQRQTKKAKKQLDRAFRYCEIPTLLKEKIYVQVENGNFRITKFRAEHGESISLLRLYNDQNFQKASRLAAEIANLRRDQETMIIQEKSSVEKSISYFRESESAEAEFKQAVEGLVKKIGSPGLKGKFSRGVKIANKTSDTIDTLVKIAKKIALLVA